MALNEALTLNITEAQRQIALLESQLNQLAQPVNVPVNVTGSGELQEVRRELGTSESATAELNRELGVTDDRLRDVASDANRAGRDIEQAGRRGTTAFSGLGTSIKTLGGTLIAFAGAQQLGQFIGDSITAASNLEQSVGALDAVFGDLSESVGAFGETADQSVGLAASQFNQLASVLGSQLQTFGFNVEDAAAETQNLIVLASDLAATFGGPVSQAVEAISSLLRGEVNPIERYGVAMNETSVQARALEDGLAATASELTFQDKTLARLAILMEQTANAQGQFGREAETTAGQMERLNAEWENTQAIVGGALVPALQAVLPIVGAVAEGIGVIGLQLADSLGLIEDEVATLQILAIQSGQAADSVTLLAGAVLELQNEMEGLDQSGNQASEATEDFADNIQALVDAWAGGGREAQDLIENLDVLQAEFGLTETAAEALRVALQRRIQTEFATAEDAALLNNLAREFRNLSEEVDRSGPLLSGFGEGMRDTADGAAVLTEAVGIVEEEFGQLPDILGVARDALEDAEGEIITDAETFLEDLRLTFESQKVFEDNIAAAEALGLDNLAAAAREFGPDFAPILADALTDPEIARQIDTEFATFADIRAAAMKQSITTALLREFSGASIEVLVDVDVLLGNVRLPGAGNLFENLAIPATGTLGNTGSVSGSGGGGTVVNNTQIFTDPATPSTTTARASQSVSSIGNYR